MIRPRTFVWGALGVAGQHRIAAANKAGVVMVFSGMRHFLH